MFFKKIICEYDLWITIFSEPLENILQEKLFKANTIVLEVTVSNVLESTLEIRDKILDRLKNIREGKQEICKDQNVGQEDFLSMVRMEMMRVILKIIEEGEATTDRLQVNIIHVKFFVKWISRIFPWNWFHEKMYWLTLFFSFTGDW